MNGIIIVSAGASAQGQNSSWWKGVIPNTGHALVSLAACCTSRDWSESRGARAVSNQLNFTELNSSPIVIPFPGLYDISDCHQEFVVLIGLGCNWGQINSCPLVVERKIWKYNFWWDLGPKSRVCGIRVVNIWSINLDVFRLSVPVISLIFSWYNPQLRRFNDRAKAWHANIKPKINLSVVKYLCAYDIVDTFIDSLSWWKSIIVLETHDEVSARENMVIKLAICANLSRHIRE